MRWQGDRESENIEDRRGTPGGPIMITGGLGTLLIVIVSLYLGIDPTALLRQVGNQQAPAPGAPAPDLEGQKEVRDFVAVVLADTEDVWSELFRKMGKEYEDPTLVLFSGEVQSACGNASAAMGPFYCPLDRKVYLDLDFFEELRTRFRSPGNFAQAYVAAHEIGHHVQNQLGTMQKMQQLRARLGPRAANDLSVRLELQADFLAGVWAHHAQRMRNILEPGDIDAALRAATAIGDDRLQKQAQGYVVPDSFTHGTSEQRARWFRKGFETGDISAGDTFNTEEL
jgi:predicted metalloprotease